MKYGLCEICKKNRNVEPHHKKKRSQGGSDKKINVIYICRFCHIDIHNCKGEWKKYTTKSFQKDGLTVENYEIEKSAEERK